MSAKSPSENLDDIFNGYSALIDKLLADNAVLRAEVRLWEAKAQKWEREHGQTGRD